MSVSFFYHLMFVITLLSCIYMLSQTAKGEYLIKTFGKIGSISLLIIVVTVLATLPIPWNSGGDRELYANAFIQMQMGFNEGISNDRLFSIYTKISSYIVDYAGWFFLTAFIYCINHYKLAQKLSKEYTYIIILMFFTSFMFYSYGVNTIRAGFAASFLLLAIANFKRVTLFYLFIFVAIGCHKSMMIPGLALILSKYFNRTRLFFYGWLLSVLLSAVFGTYFEALFASMAIDSRTSYLMVSADDTHYKVGFRIDFILYSCLPIFMGYYYVVKRSFKDELYSLFLNTYILANAFGVLVIRANFSDRFAYLSWFIYPIILIYPLLKIRLFPNQNRVIVLVVFLHELFTYIMFLR